MPRREWTQKNPLKAHAKRPSEVYTAVRKQYCKGRSYSETTRVVSRWANSNGLPGVSRQTVSKHFAEAGEKLWFAIYVDHNGKPPPANLTPQDDVNHVREYVYLTRQKYIAERELFQNVYANKPYMRTLLPWIRHEPLSGHKKLIENKLVNLLRDTSKRFRGLPESTFYIHYARAYWIERFSLENPNLTDREIIALVFEQLCRADDIYIPKKKRALDKTEEREAIAHHFQYYILGRNLIRIGVNVFGDRVFAEKYDRQRCEMIRNDEYMLTIMFGDPDDLREIDKAEFASLTGLEG